MGVVIGIDVQSIHVLFGDQIIVFLIKHGKF